MNMLHHWVYRSRKTEENELYLFQEPWLEVNSPFLYIIIRHFLINSKNIIWRISLCPHNSCDLIKAMVKKENFIYHSRCTFCYARQNHVCIARLYMFCVDMKELNNVIHILATLFFLIAINKLKVLPLMWERNLNPKSLAAREDLTNYRAAPHLVTDNYFTNNIVSTEIIRK